MAKRLLLALGLALLCHPAQGQLAPDPLDPPAPVVVVRVRVPAEATPGADLTYRLTAENVSGATAHHVRVKATLPKGATLVSSRPAAEEEAGAAVWKIGHLKGRERREMTLVVKPTGDEDAKLCARVQYEHGECVSTRMVRPGLQFRRTGPEKGTALDPLAYRLEVSNTGRGTAKDVVIEEALPPGLLLLDSKPPAKEDKTLVWRIGDLAPGRSRVIEYRAAAEKAGDYEIKGEARAAGDVRRESSLTVRVGGRDRGSGKAKPGGLDVAMTGPETASVTETVRYAITVSNPGAEALKDVTLADELPAEVAFVGATGGGKLEGNAVRWRLGTIPAGGKREVTLEVNATEAGTFKNVCTATAAGGLREQGKAETVFKPR
ncbi:MAG: DUF11 domain-containing protein [Gemmataceae bacterium]|nr:DUF11 domain-containing protein [Gemmataceae bacterium]